MKKNTLCGADCNECELKNGCRGCIATDGKPFGGDCITAECIKKYGEVGLLDMNQRIMEEFNALDIPGMPEVTRLVALCGSYVNLEYTVEGRKVKLLDEKKIYLGYQLECEDSDRCFGLVAGKDFLLVCTYGSNGENAELVAYKKRR